MENANEATKSKTSWYIEPLDSETNSNAMADLAHQCGASDDNIYYGKTDNEGLEHDVVEVEYKFINRMLKSVAKFHHRFAVFVKEEHRLSMRRWTFGQKGKLAQTKKVRQIMKQLEDND